MAEVSIIVPIYNVERYLDKCINSLLIQSLADIEIILVDDGSTDNSGKICDEYALQDSRIKVIHQENMGLSGARNTGIGAVTSKWFIIVDGDDWLEYNAVELLYSEAVRTNSDICISSFFSNYQNKEVKDSFFTVSEFTFETGQMLELQKNCLCYTPLGNKQSSTNMGVTWARIYKKSFIDENQLRFKVGLKRMQDAIFHLRALEYAKKVRFFDTPTYHYRIWNESASKKYSKDFDVTAREIMDEIRYFMSEFNKTQVFLTTYNTKCVKLLLDIIKLKYVPKANKDTLFIKLKDINKLLKKDEYKIAIKYADSDMMTKNQAMGLKLIRYHMVFIVYLLYKFKSYYSGKRGIL